MVFSLQVTRAERFTSLGQDGFPGHVNLMLHFYPPYGTPRLSDCNEIRACFLRYFVTRQSAMCLPGNGTGRHARKPLEEQADIDDYGSVRTIVSTSVVTVQTKRSRRLGEYRSVYEL